MGDESLYPGIQDLRSPKCAAKRTVGFSRAADCGSLMELIAIAVRGDGEWVIVHQCGGCDELHLNRTAGDDNPLVLLRLAVRPLAHPPFLMERIGEL
jgi:hypothetical protein